MSFEEAKDIVLEFRDKPEIKAIRKRIIDMEKIIYDALSTHTNELIAWANDLNELAVLLYQAGYDQDAFMVPADIIITKRSAKKKQSVEISSKEYGEFYGYFLPLLEENE